MLLFCVGGSCWKIYKAYRNKRRCERIQQQMNYMHTYIRQISAIRQLNEENVRITEENSSNTNQPTIIYLPVQSLQTVSEKLAERYEIAQPEIPSPNNLQQPNNKEERECPTIVPIKDTEEVPPSTN
ncbi:unnamed protein product [Rotaria sp. Silwood1]|nr:unnamed protein product [Rotaria sp. Silwood1]